jgi:hypothetical protein
MKKKIEQMKYRNNNGNVYRIFVNGEFINGTDDYTFAMNRGLGIALLKGLEFINTKSKLIIDKWVGNGEIVIITKYFNDDSIRK